MNEADNFNALTDLIRQADAYVFLTAWLYLLYSKRIRWGWDFDKMEEELKNENKALQELVKGYQDKTEARLEKLESKAGEVATNA